MEELFEFQELLFLNLSDKKRYLLDEIDIADRLIAVKGARGSGKTTILLQLVKNNILPQETSLYVSLDNLYFLEHKLLDFAKEFSLQGGTHLLLDEVHKYPNWSRELKLIYDLFPKISVVFTSSSMLEIYKGESDLSRRVVTYHLKELSFREYLFLKTDIEFPIVALNALLENHKLISQNILNKLENPLKYFKDYLETGAYPYFLESEKTYIQKLLQTIHLIIEVDVNAIENIPYEEGRKIKKLLVAIAQSAPFTPNISKLSERLGMSRVFLLNAIKLLNRADLILELFKPGQGIGQLTKPQKIYLNNSNLVVALGKRNSEIGTIRETFFASQLKHLHEIHLANKGDFLVDLKYTFEVGGKGKSNKQIEGVQNAYIVRDDIEIGFLRTIPLYLFGFLY